MLHIRLIASRWCVALLPMISLIVPSSASAQQPLPVAEEMAADSLAIFTDLDDIVVTARKRLVKVDAEKVSYDVAGDPDAKTSTVIDMLRRVPRVTVDGQDNILVNGKSDFKVYVDGKPNAMLSGNPSTILKALPAATVEKFEVITSPGAAYDAEGVGGVLNIVMKKSGDADGYSATASVFANLDGAFGNLNLLARKGKFSWTGNLAVSDMRSPDMHMDVERISFPESFTLHNSAGMKNHFSNYSLSLQGDWAVTKSDLLSVSLVGRAMKQRSDMTASVVTTDRNLADGYRLNSRSNTRNLGLEASADYTHTFSRGHTLAAAWRFSDNPLRARGYNDYLPDDAYPSSPVPDAYASLNRTNMIENIGTLDYLNTFSPHHKLGAGAKFTLRNASSRDVDLDYRHLSRITAGYVTYTLTAGKFSFNPGLRYEHTRYEVSYRKGSGADFNTDYNNLVPSAAASWAITPVHNLSASYNMRISRPGISYLNPYIDNKNPLYVTFGNPQLSPETTNKLNLSYSGMVRKVMLNASLSYDFTSNGFATYITTKEGVTYTTYYNSLHSRDLSLAVFANWSPSPATTFMLNSTTSRQSLRSPSPLASRQGWKQTVFFGYQQTLPWRLRLMVNIFATTPELQLQGRGASMFFHNLGVSRSFLADKLSVMIMAQCPFYGKMPLRMMEYGTGADGSRTFSNSTVIKADFRNVLISVSYTFGNLQPRRAATKRTDDTDLRDASSGAVQVSAPGTPTGM